MQQGYEYILEQSRNDKIKTLGFLCYNLYVDGVMIFPETNEIVKDIKKTLNYLLVLRQNNINPDYLKMQEATLNEKLTELGCICFNLYIDNKLFDNKLLSLCNSIYSINHEIANRSKALLQTEGLHDCEEQKKPRSERRNTTQSKLKVTCPRGMEQIPVNFKSCICGYRNRPEAKYCAKCGAKLS